MNIILIGNQAKIREFKEYIAADIVCHDFQKMDEVPHSILKHSDVLLNFDFDQNEEDISSYPNTKYPLILLSAVLKELPHPGITNMNSEIFGFNGLQGFISNDCWEISNPYDCQTNRLIRFLELINKEMVWVKNQVGMVAPRILFQILKEADQAYINKIATKTDIDLAMKLGTNYPKGPFQWIDDFSENQISDLLETIRQSSNDSRYEPTAISVDKK